MKSRKIQLLEKILRYFATKALRRFKPRVVGVTGSVGKTSTKEAIFAVLSAKYRVRKNEKNYNNEIGLPLTVLGLESGEGNIWRWLAVLLKAVLIVTLESKKRYPEILVLEMGADRPGDIKYLVNFLKPEVGVVTAVGISHLEFFKDIKQIAKEKSTLVRYLAKNGLAVLNFDDEAARKMAEEIKAEKIFYGFLEKANVRASDIFFGYEKTEDFYGGDLEKIRGISFKLNFNGVSIPVRLMQSVGRPQIYSVLAAAAVGTHFGMNLLEIADALKNFQSPAGRLNIIDGIKNTIIIEDSYNAAPQSTLAALEVLGKIKARRRLAALGNMLELGAETESGHREVGRKVAETADMLFAVGEKAKFIADEAEKAGLDKKRIFCYNDSIEAKIPIQNMLQEGDIILIKGSQGARMELISEEIMRFPEQSEKLLPRQTSEWKK
ncbi:MAG: UDP-N-acetylmuramoylalanyl-D-glutamyl-2,6-diamin opimelate/D-alanyl-D-alanylligase, UDP-N-acetylmuramoylalanyl-D-glutamyl-2,6-diaminopimelate-D-alanyl-D-alanine ligase [Candidatus Moranbacteria bacterium GW2011_GWC1_45_18]|nr:MAG: UDP-N-acetylmuramoyl-tripeptide-D-alanyl-D-alanine ligase [Candidatus Moranbacteria bacterium GW2011_GWC2_40_12]KKT33998.1 MAG: UDP-N-acetylmuramoyl-tripeptide-D-alanyl-D-alanine ligase [Candidatus Moranbacteria bacterium GW2011_GWF2_44_10]KKT99336.1 MAG: UDP-N-acetylmuramoylalanyl-D-glutamyl-2,6-diamin opimelate/D-alanyl-D-alanylligase, UDP-N-acetylmuramoylalanyl-D-glutamyl-2,6-diaminopimelate-D-alanyl-D-alanine ligase [Candidatus Moranbacteria bacterium GW2011_GWC1_45_18]OGI23318.1 MAG